MTLLERLNEELRAAMRANDTVRKDTIRLLMSAIHRVEVDRGRAIDDQGAVQVVQREVRQRRESIAEYQKAGRTDLADREEAELAILQTYLPAQVDREAISTVASRIIEEVGATSPSDLGKVMPRVMAELRGKAEGREISAVVAELLRRSP